MSDEKIDTTEEMNTPNPDDFSKYEKPTQYRACFRVTGEIWADIEADSEGEAKAKAMAMAQSDDFGFDLDELGDVRVLYVHKKTPKTPMFRVLRDGLEIQVSRLKPGDEPRDPRPDGF